MGPSIAIALLAASRIGGPGPTKPVHSWDTLPVAWHSALDSDPTAEELLNLSRYALVTLEKSQSSSRFHWQHGLPLTCQNGTDLSTCGCCEEDNHVRVGRAIKQINPAVHVISYMNSVIAYPWYRSAIKFTSNASWWLKSANGSYLNNIAENPVETWHAWNFAVPEVQALWIEACRNMTNTGAVDGCFADGCANWNPDGQRLIVPGPLTPEDHHGYQIGKLAFLAQLQSEIDGLVVCGSGGGFVPGVRATQVQNWGVHSQDYAGLWMPMLRTAVEGGIIFEAHAACGSSDPADPVEQTKLAAFLIAAGPGSYYLCGGWGSSSVAWFPIYDLPLGPPLSNATLANGVYTRRFASGTSVSFDARSEPQIGTIDWAKDPNEHQGHVSGH